MKGPEYEEILASLQEIVRQAYALGRSDALKQVVDVLKTDAVPPKPLALTGPAEVEPPLPSQPANFEHAGPAPEAATQYAVHDSGPDAIPGNTPDRKRDSSDDADRPPAETATGPWWSRPSRVA